MLNFKYNYNMKIIFITFFVMCNFLSFSQELSLSFKENSKEALSQIKSSALSKERMEEIFNMIKENDFVLVTRKQYELEVLKIKGLSNVENNPELFKSFYSKVNRIYIVVEDLIKNEL
jgi:hypothetical protein